MKFYPKYLPQDDLLLKAGFSSCNRGYEIVLPPKKVIPKSYIVPKEKPKRRRLHAVWNTAGFISLHIDTNYDQKGKHKVHLISKEIKAKYKELELIDETNAPWYMKLLNKIKDLLKDNT